MEIFNPQTLHKEGAYDVWDLFKQVTGYQNPKLWNIQKDFKVFDWNLIEDMMKEILKKYTVVVGEDEGFVPRQEGEGDDIEDELVKANRDLLEEFARMQEKGENQKRAPDSSVSISATHWQPVGSLPGHACLMEGVDLHSQHGLPRIERWVSFDEKYVTGLDHTASRTISDASRSWHHLSESQARPFAGYTTDADGQLTDAFDPNLRFSQPDFDDINLELQHYYEQGQFIS